MKDYLGIFTKKKYGKIPKGLVLRHLCNNPSCCNIKHLKVGTYKENAEDKIKCGRSSKGKTNINCRGSKNAQSKLTEEQVKEIYLSKLSLNNLARIYNVSNTNISYIKRKYQWKWLTDTLDT